MIEVTWKSTPESDLRSFARSSAFQDGTGNFIRTDVCQRVLNGPYPKEVGLCLHGGCALTRKDAKLKIKEEPTSLENNELQRWVVYTEFYQTLKHS